VRSLLLPVPWGDEAIVDSLTTNRFPAARPDIGDGVGNLAWTHSVTAGTWEVVDGTWTPARPYVKNLVANPNELAPEAGSTSTITYTLSDDTATSLTVTAKVYVQ